MPFSKLFLFLTFYIIFVPLSVNDLFMPYNRFMKKELLLSNSSNIYASHSSFDRLNATIERVAMALWLKELDQELRSKVVDLITKDYNKVSSIRLILLHLLQIMII